jgi:hypothetical protein
MPECWAVHVNATVQRLSGDSFFAFFAQNSQGRIWQAFFFSVFLYRVRYSETKKNFKTRMLLIIILSERIFLIF